MGDVVKPTGRAQDLLLAGLWPGMSESEYQDTADKAGEIEPSVEEAIADYRLGGEAFGDAAHGDVFDPAKQGMKDTGLFMNATAGFTTDRAAMLQKVALEGQELKTLIAGDVAEAVPAIERAWAEGDDEGANRLIAQWRGIIGGRIDTSTSTITGYEQQHNESVPAPQYADSSNAAVVPQHDSVFSGAGTNPTAPSSLASYSSRASSTTAQSAAPLTSSSSPGQGVSDAGLKTAPTGAAPAAPAAATPSSAPATPAAASGGAGAGATGGAGQGSGPSGASSPAASTKLMGAGSPASTGFGGDFRPAAAGASGMLSGGSGLGAPGVVAPGAVAGPSAPPPSGGTRIGAPAPTPAAPASGTPAATSSQQSSVSGGGGSAARPAAPSAGAAAGATRPTAAVDAAPRPEAGAAIATKKQEVVQLQNSVLVPGEDWALVGLRTAVRTLALQIMATDNDHGLTGMAVAGAVLVGGSSSAARVVLITEQYGYVPRLCGLDGGTQQARSRTSGGKAKIAHESWRWLVEDPLWNLCDFLDHLMLDPGEAGVKVVHIVTTRATEPHPDLLAKIAMYGANFVSDPLDREEDRAKYSEVDIPAGLRHRVHQIEPAWAAIGNQDVAKDRVRAFACALAAETLAAVPGVESESPLHKMVEKARTALPVDDKTRDDVYKVRDSQAGKLVGMVLPKPPGRGDEATVADVAATMNFGVTVIAGKEAEALAPVAASAERSADQHRADAEHWWRSRAAQLVLFLDTLDEPGADLAALVCDLAYEAVSATEQPALVERLLREHGFLKTADPAGQ